MSGPLKRIISGGQTGADQGALDAAIAASFAVGGWCPNGRRTEDGALPERYGFLVETPLSSYPQRTEWNVRDSDGTLLVHCGDFGPGTKKTAALAKSSGKPYLMVDIRSRTAADEAWAWITEQEIGVLNVAGPRESGAPGIHDAARDFVAKLIERTRGQQ